MRKGLCARTITLVLTAFLAVLTACQGGGENTNKAETLARNIRTKYLESAACSGHWDLTADYGQRIYTYGIDWTWDRDAETRLTITDPENVAGTAAHIAKGETSLEYDGVILETGPLEEAGLAPMDAIPSFLTCAREGFLAECVLEDWDGVSQLHVTCRDPEKQPGQGIETQLWFEPDTAALLRGEISSDGVTVIQADCSGFAMTEASSQQPPDE